MEHERKTFVIGVSGASGSGKSTFLRSMFFYLKNVYSYLDLDGYHKHTRKERKSRNEYPDQIKANDFNRIINDVKELSNWKTVSAPKYNHRKGVFSKPKKIEPNDILFIEGLHAGMINQISGEKLIDLSIFIYPEEDLRKSMKVRRDVWRRGYSYSEVIDQIEKRNPLVEQFILPQIDFSDIIVRMYRESGHISYAVLTSQKFYDKLCHNGRDTYFENSRFYLMGEKYYNVVLRDEAVLDGYINYMFKNNPFNNIYETPYKKSIKSLIALIISAQGGEKY